MEEADCLSFAGEDSVYGMMVSAINSEIADYTQTELIEFLC